MNLADANKDIISRISSALARQQEDGDSSSAPRVQFLVFSVADGLYGVNILDTHEILRPTVITRLPNVEAEILGVINLRGNIIPVIDLTKKFADEYAELSEFSRVVVCRQDGKFFGVLVDRVIEVANILETAIEWKEVKNLSSDFVGGVGRSEKNLFLVMNLAALLARESELDPHG